MQMWGEEVSILGLVGVMAEVFEVMMVPVLGTAMV